MQDLNAQILYLVTFSEIPAGDLVTQWCNASEVQIDGQGNIWIANPMRGHWLDDEAKAEFIAWVNAQ